MLKSVRARIACAAAAGALLASPLALSHFNDKEPLQSYRQSWFAMIAMNFGPLVETAKGNMPWNDAQVAAWATQLNQLAGMDTSRGFAPGSDKGTTRAKPEIWKNMEDFGQKMDDFRAASAASLPLARAASAPPVTAPSPAR